MKRNLIRQGANSFTVTVPKRWVDEHNLAAGAEIDVVQKDSVLVISASRQPQERSRTIELPAEPYHTTVWYAVLSAYVAGYQEIILLPKSASCILVDRLKYTKSKVPLGQALQDIMNVVVGMEVLQQTKEKIIIREIAAGNPDQLASTLNRAFFVLEMVLEQTAEAIPKDAREEVLASFFGGAQLHKLHQYCLRLLEQYGYAEEERTIFVARLLTSMDEFANRLKNLLRPATKLVKGDEQHIVQLRSFLDRTRATLQKKDIAQALQIMEELKSVRIELKHKAFKDTYDALNTLLQNVIEIIV